MSKEEKAKEYAMLACGYYAPDCKPEYCNSKCQWFINSHVHENVRAYRNGYTQAEQDLSSQLAAHKEALRSMIIKYEQMLDCVEGVSHMRLDAYRDELTKAKTLLTNKE